MAKTRNVLVETRILCRPPPLPPPPPPPPPTCLSSQNAKVEKMHNFHKIYFLKINLDLPLISMIQGPSLNCYQVGLGGSVICTSGWTAGSIPVGSAYSFMAIDHEIFSDLILSLPFTQEVQLSVSGERMCTHTA